RVDDVGPSRIAAVAGGREGGEEHAAALDPGGGDEAFALGPQVRARRRAILVVHDQVQVPASLGVGSVVAHPVAADVTGHGAGIVHPVAVGIDVGLDLGLDPLALQDHVLLGFVGDHD